jgi:hypothetical protein
MGRILLETDSSILAYAVQGTYYDLSPEGVIFRDIRVSLRLNFISVEVAHVPQICNVAAHLLAAFGANQHEIRLLWPDVVLDDVNVVVASESAELN